MGANKYINQFVGLKAWCP